MTVSLELRIRNLLTEFLADALVLFGSLQTAGAVAAGTLQTIFHHLNDFLIFVESYSHGYTSLLFYYTTDVNPNFYYLPLDKRKWLC